MDIRSIGVSATLIALSCGGAAAGEYVPLFDFDFTPVRSSGFVDWWLDQPRLTPAETIAKAEAVTIDDVERVAGELAVDEGVHCQRHLFCSHEAAEEAH